MTKKSSKKAKSQRSRERAFEEGAPQRRRNRCGSRYPLGGGPEDRDESLCATSECLPAI